MDRERSEYCAEYKRYLLSRLRNRLSEQFDKDLQVFEADWKERAIDLVMNVQLEILSEFRHLSRGLNEEGEVEVSSAAARFEIPQPGGTGSPAVDYFQFTPEDVMDFGFMDIPAVPEIVDPMQGDGSWDIP